MKTWTTDDKSTWGDGPWQVEPDKMVWVDLATDLDCMIHRNRVGSLCGYVGVGPDHPWHGKHYDDIDADVHGGLTYSNKCQETATEDDGICHVPEPGREHDIWWVGFDCAHGQDYCPEMEAGVKAMGMPTITDELHGWWKPTYKTVAYVEDQIRSLAQQARAAT